MTSACDFGEVVEILTIFVKYPIGPSISQLDAHAQPIGAHQPAIQRTSPNVEPTVPSAEEFEC